MREIKILGDSPTIKDNLDFDNYADILMSAIDNFDSESSLTIGIHGGWGFGKTSLMRMLEKRLEDNGTATTIWFNAWTYGKEEPVGLALLRCILTRFQDDRGLKEKSKNLFENIGKFGIEAFLRKTTTISYDKAKELLEGSIDMKKSLREDFESLIGKCFSDRRLVIFVDDLDRCLPENVIAILEVIKLYLDVPRCIFVLGVDQDVVEQAIETRYKPDEKYDKKALICGKDYVNKIIQIPFVLPPIRVDDMATFIENLNIDENEKKYTKTVAKGTGCNPRKVKMFLNILRLRTAIVEKMGGKIRPELSAKLLVIEHAFPEFYEDIKKYLKQDLIFKLEKHIRRKPKATDEELKELLKSETFKKHYNDEDLENLLNDKPFFEKTNLEPYIHLCGSKIPEKTDISDYVSDKSLFDDLYSSNELKRLKAAEVIKNGSDSDKNRYLNIFLSKLKDDDTNVRETAAFVLGEIGDIRAIDLLIVTLNDNVSSVREHSAIALGKLRDSRAVNPLILKLKDHVPIVRAAAARALGTLCDYKAPESLIEALNDEDFEVREDTISSLGEIGDPRTVEPLIAKLKIPHADISSLALALGQIRDPRAVKPLIAALDDADEAQRYFIVMALGSIGDSRAVDPLIKALKDNDADVRQNAIFALGSIGNSKALGPLNESLNDENVITRTTTEEAIRKIKAKQKQR